MAPQNYGYSVTLLARGLEVLATKIMIGNTLCSRQINLFACHSWNEKKVVNQSLKLNGELQGPRQSSWLWLASIWKGNMEGSALNGMHSTMNGPFSSPELLSPGRSSTIWGAALVAVATAPSCVAGSPRTPGDLGSSLWAAPRRREVAAAPLAAHELRWPRDLAGPFTIPLICFHIKPLFWFAFSGSYWIKVSFEYTRRRSLPDASLLWH